jgi:hypothetical protein
VAAIVNASLFALIVNRLYLRIAEPAVRDVPGLADGADARPILPRSIRIAVGVTAALTVVTIALMAAASARRDQPVTVIGHRGSSAGPENTLAAFRLAIEEGANYVELDVQESADGEVVVVHDSDLMKVGGSPLKIWEATAAELRSVDIGSRSVAVLERTRADAGRSTRRVKGRSRMIVELKSTATISGSRESRGAGRGGGNGGRHGVHVARPCDGPKMKELSQPGERAYSLPRPLVI